VSDYTLADSIYLLFTTRQFSTGAPSTLSAATVAVYEDVTATPILTSVAVTEDLNSITGLNACTIAATAANGFNVGGHYHVVIEAGTVDSVSVVGEVVGQFTLNAGAAAADLANGVDGLGALKALIDTANTFLTDQVGTAGANLTDVGGLSTAAKNEIGDAVWDEPLAAHTGTDAAGLVLNEWQDGGRLDVILDDVLADTSTDGVVVASINAATITAAAIANNAIGAGELASDALDAIADAVWDEALAGHVDADSSGLVLNEWQDAGRLDAILDELTTNVDTLETKADTAQLDLDKITGADGATLATAQALYAPAKASDILTTALTESYATDGSTFTLSQALYMMWSLLAERSVVTTTLTAKKLDGTTSAMTFTLDDATTPTSQTRAT